MIPSRADGDDPTEAAADPGAKRRRSFLSSLGHLSLARLFPPGLAPRLLAAVLLFSSIVTLILTVTELYLDYRRDVSTIETRLHEIGTSYLGSIGDSLWNLDDRQLTAQLEGIVRLPDVESAEVREITTGRKPLIVTVGHHGGGATIHREYMISYPARGVEQPIGVLSVDASLAGVYHELMSRILVILISQGAKTFLVSLFIIFIVHRLITRHLRTIAGSLSGYDLRQPLHARLALDRPPLSTPDEFDQVVAAFNAMCGSLERAYGGLQTANADLQRDNAARAKAEDALRDSVLRFRDYAETASDWYWETDAEHRVTFVSREDMAGQCVGRFPWDFMVDDDADEVEKWRQHQARVARREPFHNLTFKYRMPDGSHGRLAASGKPVYDAQARFVGYRGSTRDMTDLTRATEALRESEQRFRDYAETASDWFWESGPDHRLTFSTATSFDYDFGGPTPIGLRRWDIAADFESEPEKWTQHIETLQRHEPFRGFTFKARRRDGNDAYVVVNGRPVVDANGRFMGYRGTGSDVTAVTRAEQAIREAKEQLIEHQAQKLASDAERLDLLRRVINAQEDERLRIARELHDQTGQDLTGLSLGLKSLEMSLRDERGLATLRWLQSLAAKIDSNLQRTAWDLRPTALDDVGLVGALETGIADWSERFGVSVDFHAHIAATVNLPKAVETTAYRVVQEALTNVLKHAAARTVTLVLECYESVLQIIVEDDGKGFDTERPTESGQLGLAGMRERLALIGGSLAIDSSPGTGTALYIRIPLAERPELAEETS